MIGVVPARPDLDLERHTLLDTLVALGGAFAAAGGVVMLVGWSLDASRPKFWDLNAAALCAVAAGGAVVLATQRSFVRSAAASRVLALVTTLVAGLALATVTPSRPQLSASLSFLNLGLAVFCSTITRATWQRLALWGAAIAIGLSLVSLTGYLYGARELFEIGSLTSVSLLTAIAIHVLGWAVVARAISRGAAPLVLQAGPGGRILRTLVPVAMVVPVGLGYAALRFQRSTLLSTEFGQAAVAVGTVLVLLFFVVRTARQVEASAVALTASESRYRTAFEQGSIGVIELDADTMTILKANAAFEHILDRPSSQILGRHPADFMHPDDQPADADVAAAARAGRPFERQTRYLRPDGSIVHVLFSGAPVETPQGPLHTLTTVSDITPIWAAERDRATLIERERDARHEVSRVSRAKDEFIANLSHELRSPLNSVYGWAQLLERPLGPSEHQEAVEAIERGVQAQVRLVEDLSDMSSIASGQLHLDKRLVDATAIVEGAVNTLRPDLLAKQLDLRLDLGSGVEYVFGDPSRLQQIVRNLLSNAIKFTPHGGRIAVTLMATGQVVDISVRDTGRGLQPDELRRIFTPFHRANGATSRRQGGPGLGLAIVKYLVEQHGGLVSAQSPGPGLGSTFVVRLPIAASGAGDAPTGWRSMPVTTPVDVALGRVRVLIVDDDPDTVGFMKRLLTSHGAIVEEAHSGREALNALERTRPDVLLCDVEMPEMDGFEVVRRIRDRQLGVRICAVTAFARAEGRLHALEAGYDDHLSKPVDAQVLLETVRTLAQAAPSNHG